MTRWGDLHLHHKYKPVAWRFPVPGTTDKGPVQLAAFYRRFSPQLWWESSDQQTNDPRLGRAGEDTEVGLMQVDVLSAS